MKYANETASNLPVTFFPNDFDSRKLNLNNPRIDFIGITEETPELIYIYDSTGFGNMDEKTDEKRIEALFNDLSRYSNFTVSKKKNNYENLKKNLTPKKTKHVKVARFLYSELMALDFEKLDTIIDFLYTFGLPNKSGSKDTEIPYYDLREKQTSGFHSYLVNGSIKKSDFPISRLTFKNEKSNNVKYRTVEIDELNYVLNLSLVICKTTQALLERRIANDEKELVEEIQRIWKELSIEIDFQRAIKVYFDSLNLGLTKQNIEVRPSKHLLDLANRDDSSLAQGVAQFTNSLYNVTQDFLSNICLLSYYSLMEDLPFKVCENDRCKVLFQKTFTENKAKKTLGVKYCSITCRNNVNQRKRKRKIAKKKEEAQS
jgi:hypothetical protein